MVAAIVRHLDPVVATAAGVSIGLVLAGAVAWIELTRRWGLR